MNCDEPFSEDETYYNIKLTVLVQAKYFKDFKYYNFLFFANKLRMNHQP